MVETIFCTFIILLIVTLSLFYVRKNFDKHLKTFIEFNHNITVITTETEMIAMNRVGLKFFGFKNFNELKRKTKYLSKLFSEIVEDKKLVRGINWVAKMPKGQSIKVQITTGTLTQTFNMQVSYIRKDRYLVTFHNISRIIAEKNTISKIAEMDELTQVYNRAKFKSLLETALQNVKIHNTTFSLVIADIDHFKKINDTYGHNAGDKVLIQFTSLIRGLLRSRDAFARWGGEEFVILSESTNSKEAYLLAERLRKDIESFSFDIPDKVTCSFGVSEYMTGDTPLSIVKRADDALYKAKESGRNTVCN